MTLGSQAVLAEAQQYVRGEIFKHGHVGVRAMIHYGCDADVIHIDPDECVEDFIEFAAHEQDAVDGFALTLIHQYSDDYILRPCRIKTYDLARAVLCVQEKGDELPWHQTTTTQDGKIENPRWHGGVLTLQENVRVRQREIEQRNENLKQLNSDVEAYRLERAVELGL